MDWATGRRWQVKLLDTWQVTQVYTLRCLCPSKILVHLSNGGCNTAGFPTRLVYLYVKIGGFPTRLVYLYVKIGGFPTRLVYLYVKIGVSDQNGVSLR